MKEEKNYCAYLQDCQDPDHREMLEICIENAECEDKIEIMLAGGVMLGDGDHFRLIGMSYTGDGKLVDGILRCGGIPDNKNDISNELSEFASRKYNIFLNVIDRYYGESLMNEDFDEIGDPTHLEDPPYDFEGWIQDFDFGVQEYVLHNQPCVLADGVQYRPDVCLPSSISDEEIIEYVGDKGGKLTLNTDCLHNENKKLYEKIEKYWEWVLKKWGWSKENNN